MTRDLTAPHRVPQIDSSELPDLARVDIIVQPCLGFAFYWFEKGILLKEIGRLRIWDDTGRVDVIPYHEITEEDLETLSGEGWHARFDERPSAETGWEKVMIDGRACWQCAIVNRRPKGEGARTIRAAASLRKRNNQQFGSSHAA